MYFKPYTIKTVLWFTNLCNISIYPSFVIHLSEDRYKGGRNM